MAYANNLQKIEQSREFLDLEINLEPWLGMPNLQWYNPNIFVIAVYLYDRGIKTRQDVLKSGNFISNVRRLDPEIKKVTNEIKTDPTNLEPIYTMILRYLCSLINFKDYSILDKTVDESNK